MATAPDLETAKRLVVETNKWRTSTVATSTVKAPATARWEFLMGPEARKGQGLSISPADGRLGPAGIGELAVFTALRDLKAGARVRLPDDISDMVPPSDWVTKKTTLAEDFRAVLAAAQKAIRKPAPVGALGATKTCEECRGTGKEEGGWKCLMCDGKGTVFTEPERKNSLTKTGWTRLHFTNGKHVDVENVMVASAGTAEPGIVGTFEIKINASNAMTRWVDRDGRFGSKSGPDSRVVRVTKASVEQPSTEDSVRLEFDSNQVVESKPKYQPMAYDILKISGGDSVQIRAVSGRWFAADGVECIEGFFSVQWDSPKVTKAMENKRLVTLCMGSDPYATVRITERRDSSPSGTVFGYSSLGISQTGLVRSGAPATWPKQEERKPQPKPKPREEKKRPIILDD